MIRFLLLASFLVVLFMALLPRYNEPLLFGKFITTKEAEYIKTRASDQLKSSTISTEKDLDTSIRNSETAWLSLKDSKIREIANRCLAIVDKPISNCEFMQVVKYKKGGFYRPHYDTLATMKNPRVHTFIIALNDDYDGGATIFPNLGKMFKYKTGDVLIFDNLNNYGFKTKKAIHGGMDVTRGEKWVCNLWVRRHKREISPLINPIY